MHQIKQHHQHKEVNTASLIGSSRMHSRSRNVIKNNNQTTSSISMGSAINNDPNTRTAPRILKTRSMASKERSDNNSN